MALIKKLSPKQLEINSKHSVAEATYSILIDADSKILQIDTYGSNRRQFVGKISQSIRFSPEALLQLKQIINDNNL